VGGGRRPLLGWMPLDWAIDWDFWEEAMAIRDAMEDEF
jgi:hypothetical protein